MSCWVGWGGMITFFACGDMVDATQLWCWWMCIHGRCYAMLGVRWGGVGWDDNVLCLW